MTGEEFKAIREKLGFSQAQLAKLLGYSHLTLISSMERPKNRRGVPQHLGWLMEAIDGGFWSKDWPERKVADEPAADAEGSGEGTGDRRGHAERDAEGGGDSVRQHRSRAKA